MEKTLYEKISKGTSFIFGPTANALGLDFLVYSKHFSLSLGYAPLL